MCLCQEELLGDAGKQNGICLIEIARVEKRCLCVGPVLQWLSVGKMLISESHVLLSCCFLFMVTPHAATEPSPVNSSSARGGDLVTLCPLHARVLTGLILRGSLQAATAAVDL